MTQKENPQIQFFAEEELVNLITEAPRNKENKLRAAFMFMRWGERVKSPFDENSKVYQRHNRPLEFRCATTGKNFTATTHTVFESSKFEYCEMFITIREFYKNEKISSIALGKILNSTQTTSWRVLYKMKYVTQQLGLRAADLSLVEYFSMFLSYDFNDDVVVPAEHFLRKGKNMMDDEEIIEEAKEQTASQQYLFIRTKSEFESDCKNIRLNEIAVGLAKFLTDRNELPLDFIKEYNEIVKSIQNNKVNSSIK